LGKNGRGNYQMMPDLTYTSTDPQSVIHTKASTELLQKAPDPFKIEAVVVCDKYADFLAHTLPTNKFLFDRIVVVTSYEDSETRRVCEHYHVECLPTDGLQSRKKEFHKGVGINVGLGKLSLGGWVVHMDADIYLPPQTRILLETADLAADFIYGIDRFRVKGHDAWSEFLSMPKLQHEASVYIHTHAFPIGTRVMHSFAGGYVPVGFFQMWHPGVSGIKDYPAEHTTAGRGDTLHAERWPRALRGFIPEIIGYHLESHDSAMAANWSGRTTAPFRPVKG
jgi:hypothetical protein